MIGNLFVSKSKHMQQKSRIFFVRKHMRTEDGIFFVAKINRRWILSTEYVLKISTYDIVWSNVGHGKSIVFYQRYNFM